MVLSPAPSIERACRRWRPAALALAWLIPVPSPASARDTEANHAIALLQPVIAAIQAVMIEQQLHPPSNTVPAQLAALGQRDGAGRDIMEKTDLSPLPAPYRRAAATSVWHEIALHDRENQATLRTLLPAHGWFDRRIVGEAAARGAFLVVQHATDDLPFMQDVLARMQPLAGTAALDGHAYGLLVDRVAMQSGRPQTYGTQFACRAHRWTLYRLDDPRHVDDRRRQLGFHTTVEDDAASLATDPPCYPP